jgi:hypothetical protein
VPRFADRYRVSDVTPQIAASPRPQRVSIQTAKAAAVK